MSDSTVTIYHYPKCSKSRKALEIIRDAGIEPRIVEYLKTPLSREDLEALVAASSTPLRDMLRKAAPEYKELDIANMDDAAIFDAMIAHPVLLERPVVSTAKGTKLCRPPEAALGLLP